MLVVCGVYRIWSIEGSTKVRTYTAPGQPPGGGLAGGGGHRVRVHARTRGVKARVPAPAPRGYRPGRGVRGAGGVSGAHRPLRGRSSAVSGAARVRRCSRRGSGGSGCPALVRQRPSCTLGHSTMRPGSTAARMHHVEHACSHLGTGSYVIMFCSFHSHSEHVCALACVMWRWYLFCTSAAAASALGTVPSGALRIGETWK
jgi:hypothetical protein